MREEELFAELLERMRWNDQRCASALDVDVELIEPWRTGQRAVPDRIMDMLLKFASIHLPNWTPPPNPNDSTGPWAREASSAAAHEHHTGSYAPDSEAYEEGRASVRPIHELEEELRQLRRSYKRLAMEYAKLAREGRGAPETGEAFGPYRVLGVRPGDDWETIRSAYRAMARAHHPDRGGDPQVMQEVTEAYAELRRIFET